MIIKKYYGTLHIYWNMWRDISEKKERVEKMVVTFIRSISIFFFLLFLPGVYIFWSTLIFDQLYIKLTYSSKNLEGRLIYFHMHENNFSIILGTVVLLLL